MSPNKSRSNGFALLLVLLVLSSVISGMTLIARTAAWHTQGELQRRAWQRARLLALGGIQVCKYQMAIGRSGLLGSLTLPAGNIEEGNIATYKSKMRAANVSGITVDSDESLLIGYDSKSKQALSYVEITHKKAVISRIWVKQKI